MAALAPFHSHASEAQALTLLDEAQWWADSKSRASVLLTRHRSR
jgi:hypothetical protein